MDGNKVCSVRDLQTSGVLWATHYWHYWHYWQVAQQGKTRGLSGEWDGSGWVQQSGVRYKAMVIGQSVLVIGVHGQLSSSSFAGNKHLCAAARQSAPA